MTRCSNPVCSKQSSKTCSRCCTRYCSIECQHAHWPAHKQVCKKRSSSSLPPDALLALGNALRSQGRFDAAMDKLTEAKVAMERELGEDHDDLASVLHNMAMVRHDQAEFAEAEELYREAAKRLERSGDLKYAAMSWGSLAGMFNMRTLEYEKALEAQRRMVELEQQRLGPSHPDVLAAITGVVQTLANLGRLDEALETSQRQVQIAEETFGPNHRMMVGPLTGNALTLDMLGHHDVLKVYKRMLRILERHDGPSSTCVADTLNNIANVLSAQGKHEEALQYYKRVLQIDEEPANVRQQQDSHELQKRYATTLQNIATALGNLGRDEEALAMCERAIEIYGNLPYEVNHDAAEMYERMATLLARNGQQKQAERLHARVLRMRQRALGTHHPLVAQSLFGKAVLEEDKGNYELAQSLLSRALRICRKTPEAVSGEFFVPLVQRLVHVLVALDRHEDAVEHQQVFTAAVQPSEEVNAQVWGTMGELCRVTLARAKQRKEAGDAEGASELCERVKTAISLGPCPVPLQRELQAMLDEM